MSRELRPHVEANELLLPTVEGQLPITIALESSAWYGWLAEPQTTSFSLQYDGATFSMRREQQRNGLYWYMYHRHGSRVYKAYVGKSNHMTLRQLHEVATDLLTRPNATLDSLSSDPSISPLDAANSGVQQMVQEHRWSEAAPGKLVVPGLHHKLLPRIALFDRFDAALHYPVTIVSAPAGFGKTTSLCQWISIRHHHVAWLSLASSDNTPERLWRSVIAALDQFAPSVGAYASALLQATPAHDIADVLTALLEAIAAIKRTCILVLDDYHLITSANIHDALAFVVDHAPAQLHLILLTQADPPLPLARWRGYGRLAEVRAQELRFTANETHAFLTDLMGIQLSEDDIQALDNRIEGWVVGLHLAALALRGCHDAHQIAATFSGSHRYVLDYLITEVLERQHIALQQFLLETSILEQLSAPLCNALTKHINSQLYLEEAEQRNLFLVPLDNRRDWYRYHQLFADALYTRLQVENTNMVPILHLRAGQWYAEQRWIEPAIGHMLAAGHTQEAARLLKEMGRTLLMQGESDVLLFWLNALSDEVVLAQPELSLIQAWALVHTAQYDDAKLFLHVVERFWSKHHQHPDQGSNIETADAATLAEITAIRAYITGQQGQPQAAIEAITHAHKQLPSTHGSQIWLALSLGQAQCKNDDLHDARATYKEVIQLSKAFRNTRALSLAVRLLAQIDTIQGRLHQALKLCQQTLKWLVRRGWQETAAGGEIAIAIGAIYYEQNLLERASEQATQGIQFAGGGHCVQALAAGYALQARILFAQAEFASALDLAHKAATLIPNEEYETLQVQMQLARGDLAAAKALADNYGRGLDDTPSYQYESAYLTLVRLAIAQKQPQSAIALLDRLRHSARQGQRLKSCIIILLLQAQCCNALEGNTLTALDLLEQALVLAEAKGYLRAILDEGAGVVHLLTALARTYRRRRSSDMRISQPFLQRILLATQTVPQLSDIHRVAQPPDSTAVGGYFLTAREHELLQLVARGYSNAQIARELVIAQSTVKSHLHSAFRKLGVQNRAAAVARLQHLTASMTQY